MYDPDQNPYAAPSANLHDAYGSHGYDSYATDNVMLATRSSRLAAVMLDVLIAFIIMIPFFIVMFIFVVASDDTPDPTFAAILFIALLVVFLCLGIYNLILLHKNGQTIGKKIMKIKIVRSDLYTPASLVRIIFLRSVVMGLIGALIPLLGNIIQLADCLFIFGAEQRCLHDLIADTHVIQDLPVNTPNPDYSAQPPMASW